MPRTQRLIINDENTVYHVMSRAALDGFPLGDIEKDFMLDLNPLRAGLVERPEQYRWNSLGYHIQTNNRYRTRYFTDSGIIGSKEFVTRNYRRFKDLFRSQNEKIPRPVVGLDGVFSIKRLAEI